MVFLAIPVHLGSPFGGFTGVGAVVAISLWLWLFTALSLLGYLITLSLQHRWAPTVPTRLTRARSRRPTTSTR